MHFPTKLLVCIMFWLIVGQVVGQELPPIETYSPQQYGGGNQNWAISQSKEKV